MNLVFYISEDGSEIDLSLQDMVLLFEVCFFLYFLKLSVGKAVVISSVFGILIFVND